MKKNIKLNQWLWKWHVIGGLISLPFILLLAITGVVYLFKADINQLLYQKQLLSTQNAHKANTISYNEQLQIAKQYALENKSQVTSVTLPTSANHTTAFKLKSKDRATNTLYIDPYNAQVTGQIIQQDTLMYVVRKLHGEMLLGKAGTLTVEFIASWFIVLILTGIYVWWPKQGNGAAGFFTIRTNKGRRLFWRDLHAVSGFWLSMIMLAVVAGGMPWTDVFGSQLKWLQAKTDTGYPTHWRSSRDLTSSVPTTDSPQITLDELINIADGYQLSGQLSISIPNNDKAVYSIANRSLWLHDQQVIHLDQYSGQVIQSYTWHDVGILMELRQIFMRLHQGEYGAANWWAMLAIGLLFMLSTTAGLVSYLYRKRKGDWSIPKVPDRFNVDKPLVLLIIGLGMLFPMFGLSLVLLFIWEQRKKYKINDS